jgi:hypothetical protein
MTTFHAGDPPTLCLACGHSAATDRFAFTNTGVKGSQPQTTDKED